MSLRISWHVSEKDTKSCHLPSPHRAHQTSFCKTLQQQPRENFLYEPRGHSSEGERGEISFPRHSRGGSECVKGLKLKTDPSLFPPTHGGRSAGVGKPRGAFVWDARGKNFCLKRQTSFEVVAGIFSTGLSSGGRTQKIIYEGGSGGGGGCFKNFAFCLLA